MEHFYQLLTSDKALAWIAKITAALVIVIVGRLLGKLTARFLKSVSKRTRLDLTLATFLGDILSVAILIIAIVTALAKIGVPTASLLTVLGAAGLAIGLALKDSLSNFAAGALLMIFRPFKVGDFVELAGASGTIEYVSIFYTVVRSATNQIITVPNSHIYNGNIVNYSARDTRRIDLTIGISYADNIQSARDILARVIAEDAMLHKDPPPVIQVADLADSSVNLVVRVWTATSDYWEVRSNLMQRIKESLEAGGLSIPFPQRDVHVFEANSS